MTLNGIAQGTAYSMSVIPAIDGIRAGALAAGLSGKGPATSAIVPFERTRMVKRALRRHRGEVIETQLNNRPAHVLS
jgi:shikimate kinase